MTFAKQSAGYGHGTIARRILDSESDSINSEDVWGVKDICEIIVPLIPVEIRTSKNGQMDFHTERTTSEDVSAIKKSLGRPRKMPLTPMEIGASINGPKNFDSESITSVNVLAIKTSRERPRKRSTLLATGTERNSQLDSDSTSNTSENVLGMKKKRGRPRKIQTAKGLLDSDSGSLNSEVSLARKKTRGRPRKVPIYMRKTRGKPRKIQTAKGLLDSDSGSISSEVLLGGKKSRGRPRKVPLERSANGTIRNGHIASDPDSIKSEHIFASKKTNEMPRKVHVSPVAIRMTKKRPLDTDSDSINSEHVLPIKKARGRPLKVLRHKMGLKYSPKVVRNEDNSGSYITSSGCDSDFPTGKTSKSKRALSIRERSTITYYSSSTSGTDIFASISGEGAVRPASRSASLSETTGNESDRTVPNKPVKLPRSVSAPKKRELISTDESACSYTEDASAIKKGRGRPRKVPMTVTSLAIGTSKNRQLDSAGGASDSSASRLTTSKKSSRSPNHGVSPRGGMREKAALTYIIESETSNYSEDVVTAKKSRGRPRKVLIPPVAIGLSKDRRLASDSESSDTEDASAIKRGRGSHLKVSMTITSDASAIKKGRGRPRKVPMTVTPLAIGTSKNKQLDSAGGASHSSASRLTTSKKSSRSPNNGVSPRGGMREKAAVTYIIESETSNYSEDVVATKKSRGRPRKVLMPPVAIGLNKDRRLASDSESMNSEVLASKRRGRPRKVPKDSVWIKNSRLDSNSDGRSADSSENRVTTSSMSSTNAVVVSPRGGMREKTAMEHAIESEASDGNSKDVVVTKKSRGRPRKVLIPPGLSKGKRLASDSESMNSEVLASKKTRGRPRKVSIGSASVKNRRLDSISDGNSADSSANRVTTSKKLSRCPRRAVVYSPRGGMRQKATMKYTIESEAPETD